MMHCFFHAYRVIVADFRLGCVYVLVYTLGQGRQRPVASTVSQASFRFQPILTLLLYYFRDLPAAACAAAPYIPKPRNSDGVAAYMIVKSATRGTILMRKDLTS